MSDFIIVHKKNIHTLISQEHIELTDDWFFVGSEKNYQLYETAGVKIIIIGDCLDDIKSFFGTTDNEIAKKRGHFYAIVVRRNTIKLYNSLFSMLPIYYYKEKGLVSSSLQWIKDWVKEPCTPDKKFILENLLFNYGFFNRTLYQEIKLLPCHNIMTMKPERISISKHFFIEELFTPAPVKGRKNANRLSDLFINITRNYFPDDPFQVAFTSGFDGRTLVSCATNHKKNFATFSFGRPENDDVSIPKQNASSLGIDYQYFNLGSEEYIQSEYYKNAMEYISSGYQGNGFLYAHFLYSTKEISKKTNCLISGAAGSELFRALQNTGAVTSEALVNLFKFRKDKNIRRAIKNAKPLEVLNVQEFSTELDELIEEVIAYKKGLPQYLSPNQRFYIFVFEEIFRKFFGQWISLQQKYLNVRTPFLDYEFVKELLASKYAGANNDFFTKNPIKRMKGQYLYANIIKKTNTEIFHQKTGKGYRPGDIIDPKKIHKIIVPFIDKKLKRKVEKTNLDNLGIISGVKSNQKRFETLLRKDEEFFDRLVLIKQLQRLTAYTPEKQRDTLLMSISLLNQIQPKPTNLKIEHHELTNSID